MLMLTFQMANLPVATTILEEAGEYSSPFVDEWLPLVFMCIGLIAGAFIILWIGDTLYSAFYNLFHRDEE